MTDIEQSRGWPRLLFLMGRLPPVSTPCISSAASDVYKGPLLAKEFLPNARLMAAGGREVVFKDNDKKEAKLFEYGINAVVLGDYLTTKGKAPKKDIERLLSYGLKMAASCH